MSSDDPSGGEHLAEVFGQGWGIPNYEPCPASGDPHAWDWDIVEGPWGRGRKVVYCQECGLDWTDSYEYEEVIP